MSLEVARRSFRKFSTCLWSSDCNSSLESLVTPSTRAATDRPNKPSISSIVATVSSTVSCKSPVTMVSLSNLSSLRIPATSTG